MKKFKIMSLLLLCICLQLQAQPYGSYEPAKRMRIIIDNDFSGDVDGLFQLAHHLMCPSVDIRGIIGSHLTAWPGSNEDDPAVMNSTPRAREVVKLMGIDVPVVAGAENQLTAFNEPQPSEGARLIIREAMRTDTDVPLYVVCGASLTDVASAWLMEPEIEKRITVVWIGGREYDGMKLPAPDTDLLEFNHQLSMKSVELVFNRSQIPLGRCLAMPIASVLCRSTRWRPISVPAVVSASILPTSSRPASGQLWARYISWATVHWFCLPPSKPVSIQTPLPRNTFSVLLPPFSQMVAIRTIPKAVSSVSIPTSTPA